MSWSDAQRIMVSQRIQRSFSISGLGASRGPLSLLARQLVADGTPMEGPVAWIDPPLRPFLLSLMGVPLDVSSRAIVAAAPIAELRGRINDAFAALVRATAARQQLLLIVEDLHWAGADLLSGLAAAVAESGGAPCCSSYITPRELPDRSDMAGRRGQSADHGHRPGPIAHSRCTGPRP